MEKCIIFVAVSPKTVVLQKKKPQKICAFNSLGQTQISAQKLLYRFSLYLFSFFFNTYLTEGVFNLTKLYYF